jgi:hypothetical protein
VSQQEFLFRHNISIIKPSNEKNHLGRWQNPRR